MYIIILIIIIVLLLCIIVYPLYTKKFSTVKLLKYNALKNTENLLLEAAMEMAASTKVYMPFHEENDLYTELSKLKLKLLADKKRQHYIYFNFPRAWLLLGVYKYGRSKGNGSVTELVIRASEKLITPEGKLKFNFDKMDQVLFGLLFLELYKSTRSEKYLSGVTEVYKQIQRYKTKEGIYLYRLKDDVVFVDTLGMLLPFLYEYGAFLNAEEIIQEADFQIDYYIGKTTTSKLELPCHAYDLKNGLKLGSNNWSRGLAWFMIGLSNAVKFSSKQQSYRELYNLYWNRINGFKTKDYWPQFFCHTDDYSIDSSATIMLFYSKYLIDENRNGEIDLALRSSIDSKGFVVHNTGDTIYINKYSKIKGKSELSQGLLMWILSF